MKPIKNISLGHGGGGLLMHNLIKELLIKKLSNPILKELSDSAFIDYKEKIAFSTDSFVVNPLFFPGADIGKLSVCGTVNDLVMQGANPEYLSLALIIEEGFSYEVLKKIIDSITINAKKSGVSIVTGDLKVVEKGACDKVFINSSGIGRIIGNRKLSVVNIKPGDKIIVTGPIANHGIAVLAKRKELDLGFNIKSDCRALNGLITPILKRTNSVKFMRDPTRGGLATTLNEITQGAGFGIVVDEKKIPVCEKVRVACELLGIDPLYVANEGIAVMIVENKDAASVLKLLRGHPDGRSASIIGAVSKERKGRVILNTSIGTSRVLDMLTQEALPRIC